MLPPRGCASLVFHRSSFWMTRPRLPDIFIGLNIVRILSIVACLLVLASSFVTMVHDVEAVNTLIQTEKSNSTLADNLLDCDYVAYAPLL
jgi:hypothetical protein